MAQVERRTQTPLRAQEIAVKVGQVINRYKMAKHFRLQIEEGRFRWERNLESIEQEARLDGIYVLRTSEPSGRLVREEVVRSYKSLSQVEVAFRNLKGVDLEIRPIRHWNDAHIRAHVFLCMLAYYVEWQMKKGLAPLLFQDEELSTHRSQRDPVAPATPSDSVQQKKAHRKTAEGLPIQSFHSLLQALATRSRNYQKVAEEKSEIRFQTETELNPLQKKALQLLGLYPV